MLGDRRHNGTMLARQAGKLPLEWSLPLIRLKEVLEGLHRCDGQITDFGRPVGQIFFDPTLGNARAAERIEWEIFSLLRDEEWITTEDEGGIKRYRLSVAGRAHLDCAEPQGLCAEHTRPEKESHPSKNIIALASIGR
jgi:hypothetical protein